MTNPAVRLAPLICLAVTAPALAGQSVVQAVREFRVGVSTADVERSSATASGQGLVRDGATLTRIDGLVRFGGLGFRVSSAAGTYSATTGNNATRWDRKEATLLLGPRGFALEGGVARMRTRPDDSSIGERKVDLIRVGARSSFALSGGAVRATLAGAALVEGELPSLTGLEPIGHEAEVGVLVQPSHRVPLFVEVAYHFEARDDLVQEVTRTYEHHMVRIGAGIRLGRDSRRVPAWARD